MELLTVENPAIAIMDMMVERSRETFKVNDGDYQQNGLWFCGTCNTPKQYRLERLGRVVMPMIPCECCQRQSAKDEADYERRKFKERVDSLRMDCFDTSIQMASTFDRANECKVKEIAMNYAENFDTMRKNGKGLIFFGECGTGKTFFACCIANALIDKGVSAKITTFGTIANEVYNNSVKNEYIAELNSYALLIIDDLGAERKSDYMQQIVFDIIDSRYKTGKPLIVTTNLSRDELLHAATDETKRIYSRLLGMCIPIKVQDIDHRRAALKEDLQKYRALLGID